MDSSSSSSFSFSSSTSSLAPGSHPPPPPPPPLPFPPFFPSQLPKQTKQQATTTTTTTACPSFEAEWVPHWEDLYELQRVIGQGAYGVVWLAVDRRNGRQVAVKRIASVFSDLKEAKRTLREVRLLRHFRRTSPFIIEILDLLPARVAGEARREGNAASFQDLYVVTEYMDGGDLSRQCNGLSPDWRPPKEEHVKRIVHALLSGLRVIHKARVLHRDLRPKNLLIGGDVVKVADFGMGRGREKRAANRLRNFSLLLFVSSRYYTAPEGLLPNNEYSYPVDVWAVGCVMAELILGYNAFKDEQSPDQLRTIVNTIGAPSEEDIISIASGRSEKFQPYIRTMYPQESGGRLWGLLAYLNPEGRDFLRALLAFNPKKRARIDEALHHPWLRSVADANNTLGESQVEVTPFDGSDIEAAQEESELRSLLWKELQHYR